MHKIAKNRDEAWQIQETYDDLPHGWIQWKGTNVCMDIYCKCGHESHIDADFAYYFKCSKCNTVYMLNGHIEFIELEEKPDGSVVTEDEDYSDTECDFRG